MHRPPGNPFHNMLIRPTTGSKLSDTFSLQNAQRMVDAANDNLDGGRNQSTPPATTDFYRSREQLLVENTTGADLAWGQAAWLDPPTSAPDDNLFYPDPYESPPSLSTVPGPSGTMAIMLEPIDDNNLGLAATRGLVYALIREDDDLAWCMQCKPSTSLSVMEVDPNGSTRILWKDAGTGSDKWALLSLDPLLQHTILGKATELIEYDKTGLVTVWSPTDSQTFQISASLDWMHGDQDISAGKEVLCMWFPMENLWRIIGAECEDPTPTAASIEQTAAVSSQALTSTSAVINSFDNENYQSGDTATDLPNAAVGVTSPGSYEVSADFVARSTANNADFRMLSYSPSGDNAGTPYSIKSSGDSVSGSVGTYVDITTATPGAPAYVGLKANNDGGGGSTTIEWLSMNLRVKQM